MDVTHPQPAARPEQSATRLAVWLAVVLTFIVLGYAARVEGGEPDEGVIYTWGFGIAGTVQAAIFIAIALLISIGAPKRNLLALHGPASWGRAIAYTLGMFFGILVLSALLSPFLDAGEEQGLTTDDWQPDKAAQFALSFVAVAILAPINEELMFRGLGQTLLGAHLAPATTIVLVGVLFGLMHGLLVALPILAAFGIALAALRYLTASVYPCIVLHAIFNTFGMVVPLLAESGGS
jgi:membrane protease YdiL (CAAX protease family)